MNTKPVSNSNNKKPSNVDTKEAVLPLLSAKDANTLALNVNKDEELQSVADMIRMRATKGYVDVVIPFLSNIQYVEQELTKKGYVVIYKDVTSISISWR